MCCTRLAENTGRKKSPKIRHLGTIAQICRAISSQLRQVSTIRKNLLNSNISSRSPPKVANVGPLTAEIGLPVWAPQQILTDFASWLCYCSERRSTEANQTLHDLWSSPGLVHYYIIHFWGLLPLTEFWHVQNSLCVQVLRFL